MQKSASQMVLKKTRNSSLELLRILAMLMIVLSHACKHSQFDYVYAEMSLNKLFVQWGGLGHMANGIFMLISGYFLCTKQNNTQSLIRLFLQVWFYSITLYVVSRFGFQQTYSLYEYCAVFFPTIFQEYWFFTAYVVISLLCPYMNLVLQKADRESLRNLIIIMFIIWVLIPTFTMQSIFGTGLVQMSFYYIVGAYFRLYPDHTLKNKYIVIGYTVVSFTFLFVSTVIFNYLGESMERFRDNGTMFYSKESLFIVMGAIGIFSCFVKRKPFHNRIIDIIASCTFGVYLIHDNPAIRKILWIHTFKHAEHFYSNYLIVHIVMSVLLVFCVCAIIEYLRMRLFGKHINKISASIEQKVKSIVSRFSYL